MKDKSWKQILKFACCVLLFGGHKLGKRKHGVATCVRCGARFFAVAKVRRSFHNKRGKNYFERTQKK